MLRWIFQYFYWTPLSKRCNIDQKIILIWWAEHLFWIYSKYVQVGLKWNVGLKPQQLCHTPSLMDINRSTLEVIFIHPSHHILSPHLIGLIIYWSLFFIHTWENCSKKIFVSDIGFFSANLTSVDFGQCLVKLAVDALAVAEKSMSFFPRVNIRFSSK